MAHIHKKFELNRTKIKEAIRKIIGQTTNFINDGQQQQDNKKQGLEGSECFAALKTVEMCVSFIKMFYFEPRTSCCPAHVSIESHL